jgi:hypothetical protein
LVLILTVALALLSILLLHGQPLLGLGILRVQPRQIEVVHAVGRPRGGCTGEILK